MDSYAVPPHLRYKNPFQVTKSTNSMKRKMINEDGDSAMQRQNTYKHQPIDFNTDIRILKILPGKPDEEIICTLIPSFLATSNDRFSASRSKAHNYLALSHWWGEAHEEPKNPITIFYDVGARGDHLLHHSSTFYIRDSLNAALRRFRSPLEDVNMWIDAICIDQTNNTEKTAQVDRMHEVYMQAEKVCIWLAERDELGEETFSLMKDMLDPYQFDKMLNNPTVVAGK